MKKLFIFLLFVFFQCSAHAQEEKVIEIPIVFSQEGIEITTSACLRMDEKIYGIDWEIFKNSAEGNMEKILVEMITAMQKKDSLRLKELSHPDFSNDPQEFQQQSSAYFQQFQIFQIGEVKAAFKFDDFVVFFLELKNGEKSRVAKFLFKFDERNESYGFLNNARNFNLALIKDWFDSDWGPSQNKTPSYCDDSLKFTHKVTLEEQGHLDSGAELLLVGENLVDNNEKELLNQFVKMQESLASGQMDEYFDGFTENASKKQRDWFLKGESEALRKQYVENFVSEKPVYIFNADPVFIMYAYGNGVVGLGDFPFHVTYFIRNSDGKFKLANESLGSAFDNVFKSKKFLEGASEEKPFESWEIK